MAALKPSPLLLALAGCSVLFALVAATCETEFPPYVQEICDDTQDNDTDGETDCQDSDCSAECDVEVFINTLPAATEDTLIVSGTSTRATSVTVSVTPTGTGGRADLKSDGTWEIILRQVNGRGETHRVEAIANGASGLSDTAQATFQRNP